MVRFRRNGRCWHYSVTRDRMRLESANHFPPIRDPRTTPLMRRKSDSLHQAGGFRTHDHCHHVRHWRPQSRWGYRYSARSRGICTSCSYTMRDSATSLRSAQNDEGGVTGALTKVGWLGHLQRWGGWALTKVGAGALTKVGGLGHSRRWGAGSLRRFGQPASASRSSSALAGLGVNGPSSPCSMGSSSSERSPRSDKKAGVVTKSSGRPGTFR